jgi:hypothetical protein
MSAPNKISESHRYTMGIKNTINTNITINRKMARIFSFIISMLV